MHQPGVVRWMAAAVIACGLAQSTLANEVLELQFDLSALGQKWNGSPIRLVNWDTEDVNDPCKKIWVTNVSPLAANAAVAFTLRSNNDLKKNGLVLKVSVNVPRVTLSGAGTLVFSEIKDVIFASGASTVTVTTNRKLGDDVKSLDGVYFQMPRCHQ